MPDVDPQMTNTPPSSATPLMRNPNATLPLGPADPTPAARSYDTGGTIGRYVIDRLIGRGGMANIFLATDPTTQRQVAIKLMPYQFNLDAEMRARFQREARVIAGLEHPNVVQVYDVGEDNEQLYIVMRYMAGGSLSQRMKDAMPNEEVLKIARQVATALDEVHSRGIVHRDLKPDNVLFDAEGNAYLSDFGIVKLAESKTVQTATGMSAGTPAYMSPEQIEAKVDLDGRSDVYAFAIILFEMLTGRAPYVAETPIGLVAQHLFDPVPQIRTLKPDLPIVTQGVIERGMAKDRDERYQTASELVDELEAALDGRLLEVRKVKSAAGRGGLQSVDQDRRRVPLWAWPAGVLSIGGLVAMLLLFNQTMNNTTSGPQPTPQQIIITVMVTNDQGELEPQIVTATPDPDDLAAAGDDETEEADDPTSTVSASATTRATARATTRATARPTDRPTDQPTNAPSGDSGSNSAGSNDAGSSGSSGGSNTSGSTDSGSNTGGLTNVGGSNTGVIPTLIPPSNTPRPTNTPVPPPTNTPVPPPTATPQPTDDPGLLCGILGILCDD